MLRISVITMAIAVAALITDAAISKKQEAATGNTLTNAAEKSQVKFTSGGDTYTLIANGYAVKASEQQKVATTLATNSTEWLAQLGDFKLAISEDQNALQVANKDAAIYPIAYNARTKNPAVLTGEIVVTFKPEHFESNRPTQTHPLTIRAEFAHLNVAVYSAPRAQLVTIAQQLEEDAAIETAKIEVFEHVRVTH